jgi:RNA polymerase sigma-70 factor (ECF subfamily)
MDGNEFKRRFLSFSELIFRYSYTITGDKEEAEDIVQEVFEKLWKIRDS